MQIKKLKQKTYNLLRWSEKYFKTDMVYLAKGGSWLTLGQVVSSLSVFLLAIAFANLLPKETYGNYKFILSLAGILTITTLYGMNTAITQSVARGFEGIIFKALKTEMRWGLLGGLGSLVLAGYYFYNQNHLLSNAFLLISVFIPFMESLNIYGAFLNGKKEFRTLTTYSNWTQIIAVTVIITVLFFSNNIYLITLSYFVSYTLLRYVFLKKSFEKFKPNEEKDSGVISYGKHLSLMGVLGTVASHIDKILIFHYLGAVELAIYFFALAIPEQIKGFLKNLKALALPKFSEKSKDDILKTINSKMFKFGIILTIIAILYVLTAPIIYQIFFPQYLESVIYSQIFAITLITVLAIIPTSVLRSQKMIKELYKLNVYSSIFQIVLFFVLIQPYGLMGAIIAKTVSSFFLLSLAVKLMINKNDK